MAALEECHARSFFFKATGGCNEAKRQVNKCLAKERAKRQTKNREEARARRQKYEEAIRQRDEEVEAEARKSLP